MGKKITVQPENYEYLLKKFGDNIIPLIKNKLEFYEKNPFETKTHQVWLQKFKETLILKNSEATSYLDDVYKFYKDNFHMEDTRRIDIVLATALSAKLPGIPIWLILVGASGDMKSVQLNSLNNEDTYVLHNLTSKTLVNGYKNKEEHPDLAPELDGKIVVIPDMAQILKLPPVEKGELWGQLRDLYDGLAGKVSGQGSRATYKDLKVTLIAGSTPSIDGQILVHQDLGTRELIFRTKGNLRKEFSMLKCFENEAKEKEISDELKRLTSEFLENTDIEREEITDEVIQELMRIAIFITYMRATAEVDSYSNELRNDVYPEEPTRIAKQLKRLFICLKSLDEDYPTKRALEILDHIARSSCFPIRIKIFEHLLYNKEKEFSTTQVSEDLFIGKKTAYRELQIMWNMRLVSLKRIPVDSKYTDRTYDYWKINEKNKFIKKILEERG